ncbi:MAG: DNA mismatch endonuclease Vsr [Oscillospiraceae bacterium]|nr:DNA mismatch endonuclease Vsr [Oscillospiraceae bacterium]
MSDNHSPESRSRNMASIKGHDTTIEVQVRKYLFSKGFRFRKNDKRYPGRPDIVLPKYHTVIFIHGCFWHRHPFCGYATSPKTNEEYWQKKFELNSARDRKSIEELESMGWHVIVIWECELTKKRFEETMQRVINELSSVYVENRYYV